MKLGWFKNESYPEIGETNSSGTGGYFKQLKERLSNTRKTLSGGLEKLFSGKNCIDDNLLEELEELLITSDIGVQTAT
ncbi:MAG: hypothetical protein BWK74_07690, partial [Desulfobacteraceae bacterium A6]